MTTSGRLSDPHMDEKPRDFSGRLRIVLVGHPPIERALRRDPDVELVRAQTPLRAIGELAQPIDDDSPSATVIVLDEDSLPATHAESFAEAARRVDAGVAIVGLRSDPLERGSEVFDAWASPSDGLDTIRRHLAEPEQAGTPGTSRDDVPAPSPKPASSAPRQTELPDDAKLVRAILSGRDIQPAALEQLRRRTGIADLEFSQSRGASPCEPVLHRGHSLGYLSAPEGSLDGSQLKVHALWLSHWLALAEQQRQLREAAFTDALTGAWNRRYFDRYLDSCLLRAAKLRQPVTVLLFDVDDFKKFNDQHGHAVGDEILCATVRLLKTCVRPSDRVCRIGGDEFAVVFYEPDGPREAGSSQPTSIFDIARRFQQRVQTEEFSVLGPKSPGPLAISGGLATFPWDGRTPAELLAAADRLLMESKDAGKNAIRYGSGVLCCDDSSC